MARLTITEASRCFGVATNTIRRRISRGELTPIQASSTTGRGRRLFDISDLIRVFGEPSGTFPKEDPASSAWKPVQIPDPTDSSPQMVAENAALRARLEAQERHLEDLRQLLTPRLKDPDTLGVRAARYVAEVVRALKSGAG